MNRLKERQSEGIANAKKKGVYVGRKEGSKESTEQFLNKKLTQTIIRHLKAKESIRRAAKLSGASVGTVQKVKKELLRQN